MLAVLVSRPYFSLCDFFNSSLNALLKSSFSSSSSQLSSHRCVVPPGTVASSCDQSAKHDRQSGPSSSDTVRAYLLLGSPRIHRPLPAAQVPFPPASTLCLAPARSISWAPILQLGLMMSRLMTSLRYGMLVGSLGAMSGSTSFNRRMSQIEVTDVLGSVE